MTSIESQVASLQTGLRMQPMTAEEVRRFIHISAEFDRAPYVTKGALPTNFELSSGMSATVSLPTLRAAMGLPGVLVGATKDAVEAAKTGVAAKGVSFDFQLCSPCIFQSQCGACWAVALAGALSDRVMVQQFVANSNGGTFATAEYFASDRATISGIERGCPSLQTLEKIASPTAIMLRSKGAQTACCGGSSEFWYAPSRKLESSVIDLLQQGVPSLAKCGYLASLDRSCRALRGWIPAVTQGAVSAGNCTTAAAAKSLATVGSTSACAGADSQSRFKIPQEGQSSLQFSSLIPRNQIRVALLGVGPTATAGAQSSTPASNWANFGPGTLVTSFYCPVTAKLTARDGRASKLSDFFSFFVDAKSGQRYLPESMTDYRIPTNTAFRRVNSSIMNRGGTKFAWNYVYCAPSDAQRTAADQQQGHSVCIVGYINDIHIEDPTGDLKAYKHYYPSTKTAKVDAYIVRNSWGVIEKDGSALPWGEGGFFLWATSEPDSAFPNAVYGMDALVDLTGSGRACRPDACERQGDHTPCPCGASEFCAVGNKAGEFVCSKTVFPSVPYAIRVVPPKASAARHAGVAVFPARKAPAANEFPWAPVVTLIVVLAVVMVLATVMAIRRRIVTGVPNREGASGRAPRPAAHACDPTRSNVLSYTPKLRSNEST